MGRSQRRKGARLELEACEAVRDLWPSVRRRAMQARSGESDGADLENTHGFHVEVGGGRSVSPAAKWTQASQDCADGDTPIALTKRDRGEWLVTMSLADWKRLVRDADVGDSHKDRRHFYGCANDGEPRNGPCEQCDELARDMLGLHMRRISRGVKR